MSVLKPSDLVVLKSGGPVMTVDTINTDIFDDNKVTGVLCTWFVGNKLERARFDYNAIVPAPSEKAPSENAQPQGPEAGGEYGEYKAVLDEMVAAMNDAAEASGDTLQTSGRPKRASARKDPAQPTAPAARGMN
jgi:uncharacterized protein YodC (DUF2158 family)